MKYIYLVESPDMITRGVFSSRELAQEAINYSGESDYSIDPMKVNDNEFM